MTCLEPRYPGAVAEPADLVRLADEYRAAALVIAPLGRRGEPISHAPYRLTAIHAIELYLNGLLLHAGHEPSSIRGLQHDLASRAELAFSSGLTLRKRTGAHLKAMTSAREYLVTRYGPELTPTLSQLNRLAATLEEVAAKVRSIVQPGRLHQDPDVTNGVGSGLAAHLLAPRHERGAGRERGGADRATVPNGPAMTQHHRHGDVQDSQGHPVPRPRLRAAP